MTVCNPESAPVQLLGRVVASLALRRDFADITKSATGERNEEEVDSFLASVGSGGIRSVSQPPRGLFSLGVASGPPSRELRKLSGDRLHARAKALDPPYRIRVSREKLLGNPGKGQAESVGLLMTSGSKKNRSKSKVKDRPGMRPENKR